MTATNGHLKLKDSQGDKKRTADLYLGKFSVIALCLTWITTYFISKFKF
jgi:hypothetical protein